jgi:hypothetical protein
MPAFLQGPHFKTMDLEMCIHDTIESMQGNYLSAALHYSVGALRLIG